MMAAFYEYHTTDMTTATTSAIVIWRNVASSYTEFHTAHIQPDLISIERGIRRKESQVIASQLEPVRRVWDWREAHSRYHLKQPSRIEARRHARKRLIQKLRETLQ